MTPRDWTHTDAVEAAEDRLEREWWRKPDPFAEPDYRIGPFADTAEDEAEPLTCGEIERRYGVA